MNYNIDNTNSYFQVSGGPEQQSSVIPTYTVNTVQPLVVESIPISSSVETAKPIPVMSVQPQEAIPIVSTVEHSANNQNMSGNDNVDPVTSILSDSQFFVKCKTNDDCTSMYTFNVFPCNYFGDCNDQVEPIKFDRFTANVSSVIYRGIVNGTEYVFEKRKLDKYCLVHKATNATICKFKFNSNCTFNELKISMKHLNCPPLEVKMFTNGNVGSMAIREGANYGSIHAIPDDDCGSISSFIVIPSARGYPVIDNQTRRVIYICCCILFRVRSRE